MVFSMNVMAFVIFSLVGVARGQIEVAKDDNIEPFSLLCRIYNVAKNPPINYVDLQEANRIVEEIDALNKSLLEEKGHGEEEDAGNNSEASVKPIVTRETALAQLSLNQITQKAHKILGDIAKINVAEEFGKAKADFNKVIFGDGGNEDDLCHATVKGVENRSKACGDTGEGKKGTHAGNNLVVDFFCLCTQMMDKEGVNQVCGFYVGSNSNHGLIGWNDSVLMGSSTMWASIKGGCGKHMQQHPMSTEEARHILDQFLKHLKTGGVYRWGNSGDKVEGSERKEGMLGTAVGKKDDNNGKGLICDGKKGKGSTPAGICVYYGAELNSWEGNIPWLKQFKTALTSVDAVNNQITSIQRALQKLQMLQHRAEEIYETGKVISEIQKPVGLPAALQNVSGNLTAYNTTRIRSYGYNTNSYFFPALVLLL
ncbi:Variant surface glycoprotein [Trypanosoma congolense IL3000]|uniref:Variant surface glycoprotein n=1 Tax=Trypanosoma congolense (strain IL3000) TaxID=1068625 RepID=F9WCK8_TRYCI|nr:Variant surface glycoprotein [Trypanosoma congolense IL3000]